MPAVVFPAWTRRAVCIAGTWVLSVSLPAVSANAATDTLDTNLTVRIALEQVERALFCRDGRGAADKCAVLRLIGEGERLSYRGWPTDWAMRGIRGRREAQYAYALLLKHAGTLYGRPEYAAAGRSAVERIIAENGGREPVFRDESRLPAEVSRYYALMRLSRDDLRTVIRPGGEEGRPFWNGHARVFAYPPSFAFAPVPGAERYRFEVLDDLHVRREFVAATPEAALTPVWSQLPAGPVTVICRGVDASGREVGAAGERTFWRSAPFDPSEYAPAKRTYAEAYRRGLDYLFNWPDIAFLERNGRPDLSSMNNFTSYPSKMQSAVIHAMIAVAEQFPERRTRAMRLARIAADYLLSTAQPAGSPLAHFTATYAGDYFISAKYAGEIMLVYPAMAGSALLKLHRACGDGKYLDAARNIADTYLKLQGEDGSWYLKMREKDGSPVTPNKLVPTDVIDFLESLFDVTGDVRCRTAADRAFAMIDRGPLQTWDWEGQFEDMCPQDGRYRNLTKHGACAVAMYLLKRFPGDARRLAQAREILRFSEDQFVMWKPPCRPSGAGLWQPIYPFFAWRTPAVLEQYYCYAPIDASAAKLIRTYLALYAAEGSPLDLAKARALGDSMVNNQDESGRIRTYWIPEPGDGNEPLADAIFVPLGGDWFNCMAADMKALELLCAQSCL